MATSLEFAQYTCEQIENAGSVNYRKMFGEYMIYVNGKPVILICNDTPYVKINEITEKLIENKETGVPYNGAKPHYILDIDNQELACKITRELEKITPLPKPKKKK